jgi:hypothetical protein
MSLASRFAAKHDDTTAEKKSSARVLDTWTADTGVSRSRRGYFLVLVPAVARLFSDLSPLARQNIAWIGRVSHSYCHSRDKTEPLPNDEGDRGNVATAAPHSELGRLVWQTLCCRADHPAFSIHDCILRVECHAREMVESVCLALQTACAVALSLPAPAEAFEGPIPMTMSRTKCTHRVTVVAIFPAATNSNDTSGVWYYWGIDGNDKPTIILNQEAAQEIVVIPCDHETGQEQSKQRKVDPAAPLSRAYFKLQQIATDILQPAESYLQLKKAETAGIDLGASPGGWTQVLALQVGVSAVYAVDPAKLATRALQLSNVRHLPSSMETANYDSIGMPCAILVCDASLLWFLLCERLSDHVLDKVQWRIPAVFVVTLKLPYKTTGSLERQILLIDKGMPDILKEMATKMYPTNNKVKAIFRIVHVMANSDSERTLIAIFDDK